jgi:Zn-dependent M28 family amino/carboxypeptidase
MRKYRPYIVIVAGLVLMAIATRWLLTLASPAQFDGERALADVAYQVELGPRTPGSEAHDQVVDWMLEQLEGAGWQAEVQESELNGQRIRNVVARRSDNAPQILLGAHYDTRLLADQDADPALSALPVPGANDGASGVAVLLELARTLPQESVPVWLVFFDAEDSGRLPGWEWIMGSRSFASTMDVRPQAVVIVDMIGDADLDIYYERNSDPALSEEIWTQAAALGYDEQFIAEPNHSMTDDHTPFLELGIPAVDIIDFDYPYWHTGQDTLDKVSADSLEAVGRTLWHWILSQE